MDTLMLLKSIQDKKDPREIVSIPGSKSKRTLEQECVGLRGSGIVKPKIGYGNWLISEVSEEWLKNNDDDYLALYLNGQIKYFSELLLLCQKPMKSKSIFEDATINYKLLWEQSSQIFERTSWLIDLGYLEYIAFNSTFQTTEKGLSFLKLAKPYDYKKIKSTSEMVKNISINLSNVNPEILNMVPKDENGFESRLRTIGYIPGSLSNVLDVIIGYLELTVDNRVSLKNIINYSKETYGIKNSSIRGFISTLIKSGLFERISTDEYEITNYGKMILKGDNILELIVSFHAKYLYFFEILSELKKKPLSTNDIINIGDISYGLPVKGEVTKRIALLKNADFIYLERKKYYLTKAGNEIIDHIKVQNPILIGENKAKKETQDSLSGLEGLMNELIESSRDSANPDRFEKAIYDAFTYLGFDAEWLGKSGHTDVFLKTSDIPGLSYRVNIDAKSTYSGPVKDSQVDFDTLQEHKEKMKSNYVIVIGNEFIDGRLVNRAKDHNVGLLDIKELNGIIREHANIPLTFEAYKKFFDQVGIMHGSVLKSDRLKAIYQGDLIKTIMNSIYDNHSMSVEALFWLIKGNQDYEIKPSKNQIKMVLDFLSSPIIGCVIKKDSEYVASGTLSDAVLRLSFLAQFLSK